MNSRVRNQSGYVLLLALVILGVGAVVIGTLFGYLETSTNLFVKSEETAVTYYAADAGIQDACNRLQFNRSFVFPVEGYPAKWQLPERINGKAVNVTITEELDVGPLVYRILSSATADDGSSQTIESYVSLTAPREAWSLALFGDYALSSNGLVDVKGDIDGDILYVDDFKGDEDSVNGTVTQWCTSLEPLPCQEGDVTCNGSNKVECVGGAWNVTEEESDFCPCDDGGISWWPETQELIDFFLSTVNTSDPYPNSEIEIFNITPTMEGWRTIGPLYRDGYLGIGTNYDGLTLNLTGTVFVTGDLDIGAATGSKPFTLDLNMQTIFVIGTGQQNAINIGEKCNIVGAGSIIAVGDIYYAPGVNMEPGSFVFTMSLEGITKLNPNGDYYGSVAGDVMVQLQPGNGFHWVDPDELGYDLPEGQPRPRVIEIREYDILD